MKTYRILPVALLLTLLGLGPAAARAATLVATNIADCGTSSLRQRITAAAAGDTITFTNTLNGQTIVLTSGDLVINKNLTIFGPGATSLAISGNASSRVFSITNFGVTNLIAGLTITNGVGAVVSSLDDTACAARLGQKRP